MFSFSIPIIIRSYYSVFNHALHVYYDHEREFGATLDVLTNPELSEPIKNSESQNDFVSLAFTYHNKHAKSSHPTLIFSMMKISENTLIIRVTNNADKFILFTWEDSDFMKEMAKIIVNTCTLRCECEKYLSTDYIVNQSKRLLENFSLAIKMIIDSPEPTKSAISAAEKIISLIKSESQEFSKIISLNADATTARRPGM